jgi:hypothetical protein
VKHLRVLCAAIAANAFYISAVDAQMLVQRDAARAGPSYDNLARRVAKLRARWIASGHRSPGALPAIVSASFVQPQVNVLRAPGAPEVALKLKSGDAGISYITLTIANTDDTESVYVNDSLPAYPLQQAPIEKLAILCTSFFEGFGIYSKPGTWSVTSISVTSNSGSSVYYSGADLASVFPNNVITIVNNGPQDLTLPSFGAGQILTPTVSLGGGTPYFAASLEVAHKGFFGVTNISLSVQPPGEGFPLAVFGSVPGPLAKGKIIAYDDLQGDPVGIYTITNISVCDIANNCLNDSSAADIKAAFGTTTFTVTN